VNAMDVMVRAVITIVIVRSGVVHLWGLVSSEAERKALAALAEEVPGVVRVPDEMIPAY
jgi:osmotically-inducible protein OsmY